MPKRRRKSKNTSASDVGGEDSVILRETVPLQMRYYGDPVLRKRAEPVAEITDAERQLAEQMLMTLKNTGIGIGLAATQVGVLKRLIIVDSSLLTSAKRTTRNTSLWCCLTLKF